MNFKPVITDEIKIIRLRFGSFISTSAWQNGVLIWEKLVKVSGDIQNG